MNSAVHLSGVVPHDLDGLRLDQVLVALFPHFSRSRQQAWIHAGYVLVDGQKLRPRDRVCGGARVDIAACFEDEHTGWAPESLALDIVYEDDALLVVNKPVGLVVHPAAGNREGTLANALLHYAPELQHVPRAGLVHRLDQGTSGLLLVARTLAAHTHLVDALRTRAVSREYEAVVYGRPTAGGTVDAAIGRHPVLRKRMAVVESGRPARTHYRVLERFRAHARLRVLLETGRTHQIRVHMAHRGLPLVGDPTYGGRVRIPTAATPAVVEALRAFRTPALHARRLALAHPLRGDPLSWEVPPPQGFAELCAVLRKDLGAQRTLGAGGAGEHAPPVIGSEQR